MRRIPSAIGLLGWLTTTTTTITIQALAPPLFNLSHWEEASDAFRQRRRLDWQLAQGEQDGNDSDPPRQRRRLNPSIGEFRVPVFLVQFTDHLDKPLPTVADLEELLQGEAGTETNPVGSIAEYLRYSSMGRYRVFFDIYDWRVTNGTEADFARGNSMLFGPRTAQDMFVHVLDEWDATGTIDWSIYDPSGRGRFDHFVILHSGHGAEVGNGDIRIGTCGQADFSQRIWAQGSSGRLATWTASNGIELDGFMIASALGPDLCSFETAKHSIITHEYLHGFALLDLYDLDFDQPQSILGGTGRFDLMSNLGGWNNDLRYPGHLSVFSRITADWLEPIEITKNGYYSLIAAEVSSQVYVIRAGFPEGEYLAIENRQPIKWSEDWPGGGILITHIDEAAPGQSQRSYPGQPNWPAEHYEVSVLQADSLYELERGANTGDLEDLWTKDSSLGPGTGNVWPNTDSIQGGVQRETGIRITIITDPGFIMAIRVEGLQETGLAPRFPEEVARVGEDNPRNDSTGETMYWIMSLLSGVAFMTGMAFAFL